AMAALSNFNRRYELVVARSVGISAWQFLAPLCLASLVVGLIAIAMLNPLSAWAFSRAEVWEGELRGRTAAPDSEMRMPWLRQQTEEGAAIIGALNSAEKGRLLFNATIFRFEPDGSIRDRLDAERAVLVDGAWELHAVTIHRAGRERETADSMRIRSGLRLEFIEEQLARPESIPFFDLP